MCFTTLARSCVWFTLCMVCWVRAGTSTLSMDTVHVFEQNLQRYYGDAGWICKDLSRMTVSDVALCWSQLALLISDKQSQWFYQWDTPEQYEQLQQRQHYTYEAFVRDSVDAAWLEECRQFHHFLTNYFVDNSSGVLIEKQPDMDKDHYTELATVLWTIIPDALAPFYALYFEKLVNAFYKKLNYLFTEQTLDVAHLSDVVRDKALLKRLYTICVHQSGQLSDVQARELAYHYRRVEEVYQETLMALAKRYEVTP